MFEEVGDWSKLQISNCDWMNLGAQAGIFFQDFSLSQPMSHHSTRKSLQKVSCQLSQVPVVSFDPEGIA
jgi:hypothetical protein